MDTKTPPQNDARNALLNDMMIMNAIQSVFQPKHDVSAFQLPPRTTCVEKMALIATGAASAIISALLAVIAL